MAGVLHHHEFRIVPGSRDMAQKHKGTLISKGLQHQKRCSMPTISIIAAAQPQPEKRGTKSKSLPGTRGLLLRLQGNKTPQHASQQELKLRLVSICR
jgi:hypothetical protein